MDIKQYIESGILESYVLGGASSQEIREVECLSSIYPEIKTELSSIQDGMEKYVQTLAVSPPPQLKDKILAQIKNIKQAASTDESPLRIVKDESIKTNSNRKSNLYKIGLAASILLLVGLFAYQIKLSNDLSSTNNELAELKESNSNSTNQLIDSLNRIKQREQFLADASTNSFLLAGTEVSPESKVRVFWSKTSSEIVIIQDDLPRPTAENQYQLWGLVDGAPVSLGTLDKTELISEVRKISLDKVDAFAITLEKDGGSATPNLEQLFVIGNT